MSISKLIRAGTWLTAANVVSRFSSALVLPLLARMLGPSALGIYSIVFAMAQTGQSASSLGIEAVMHRNGAQHKTIGEEAVGRLFGVGLILICLVSVLCGMLVWLFRAPLAVYWLGKPDLADWLGIAALLIALQPLGTVPLLFLASLQEFRAYALRSTLGVLFGAAVTAFMAWRQGLPGAILGMVISAVLQIGLSILLVRPALKTHAIRLRFDRFWQETRSILRLGFPYYYGNTLLGSLVVLPIMGLVGRYGGLGDLGYLRVAQSLAAIIGFIPTAIAPAALSYLSASLAADVKTFQHLRLAHLRSVWSLLLILTCVACLVLPDIIRIVFGPTYVQTYRLAWISLWLSLLVGVMAVLVQYLVVAGKMIRIAWVCTLGVISFIGASLILVPRFHALGFLVAQLIGQGVSLPFVLYPTLVESTSEQRGMIRNLGAATLAALVWTFVFSSAQLNLLTTLMATVITAVLLGAFLFFKVLTQPERIRLKQLVAFRASYA